MKCIACKMLNTAIETDKHPSVSNFLTFKRLNDSVLEAIKTQAKGTLAVCPVHREVEEFKKSTSMAVKLVNLKRNKILAGYGKIK